MLIYCCGLGLIVLMFDGWLRLMFLIVNSCLRFVFDFVIDRDYCICWFNCCFLELVFVGILLTVLLVCRFELVVISSVDCF